MARTESGVRYDQYDLGINADPYPVYRRLREEAPLYYSEEYDFWALSRHADVEGAAPTTQPSPIGTEPFSR
jgi:cytochrome P450